MKFHENYTKVTPLILILVFTAFTGCLDFFSEMPTMYEPHPTSIHYDIRYGYRVNTSGTGRYSIEYLCDLPEVLQGSVVSNLLYQEEYENVTLVNNQMVQWNISNENSRYYELGIVAHVDVESYLLADLNGAHAWTVDDIARLNPEILEKFGQPQANETMVIIDPFDPMIYAAATMVQNQSTSNNSLLLAKSLFIWLKENTQYQIHGGQGNVQPARLTLQKKSGDCDDLSFLYISLCRAIGIPARFIRGYLFSETNGGISATAHAWVEVYIGGSLGNNGWIPVECACCTPSIEADINQNFGVENAFHLRLFVDDGSNESLIVSQSGIVYTYIPGRQMDVELLIEIDNYLVVESQKLIITAENIRSYE